MKKAKLGKGERHYKSKLTEKEVVAIFYSVEDRGILAKRYNVSRSNIDRIKNKETWKHLWKRMWVDA